MLQFVEEAFAVNRSSSFKDWTTTLDSFWR